MRPVTETYNPKRLRQDRALEQARNLLQRRADDIAWFEAFIEDHLGEDLANRQTFRLAYEAMWPTDAPPEWWSTALGQVMAMGGARPRALSLSRADVATMLGIKGATVNSYLHKGVLLHSYNDKEVSTASVMRRYRRSLGA